MQAWLRYLTVLVLFSLGNGIGQYTLAPGGAYRDYTMQGVSHDWHRYLWAVSVPGQWPVILAHALFVGALSAIIVVPIGAALGFLLFSVRPALRERVASCPAPWLYAITVLVGFVVGVGITIVAGRNPGII
jgi:ABC-type spermidine/putrescine transport system permease subunit II